MNRTVYLYFMHQFLFSIQHFYHEWQWLLFPIFIGVVAGLFSQMFLPGKGFGLLASFLLGLAGSFLGRKYLMKYLGVIENKTLREIASATIGALILMIAINLIRRGTEKDKTSWRNNA